MTTLHVSMAQGIRAGRRAPGGRRRPRSRRPARGFTLIETALATVIVGVGVLAIVAAQQAFHKKNSWSTHASVAMRLGNEIREMTLNLPRHDPVTWDANWGPETGEAWVGDFDDVDDFDGDAGTGLVFSAALANGPVNAMREIIPDMDGWSQEVRVYHVNPFDITETVADGASDLIAMEVIVRYQGPNEDEASEITRVSWIAPN